MLTLYRRHGCAACDEIETQLRELRLAHKIVCLEEGQAPLPAELESAVSSPTELPMLEENGQRHTGIVAIRRHVERVAQLKDRWQKHGADACFCDDDGEVL